jgi:4-diphosphocytidyl-2-C-methyl-D-erythritol kinase
MPVKISSPAKINLFLKVVRKRPDGYHDLETLFERIDLCDEIVLKKRTSGLVLRTSADLPKDSRNLALRAAELLKEECGVRQGAEIVLKKNIPVSAGLGGGSSNAASVLLGLNRLWKLRLSKKKLLSLGARLGSDVPFFVLDTPFAWGRGRGEKLTAERSIRRKWWHVVVKPAFGISTKQAYAGLSLNSLTPPRGDAKMLLRSLRTGNSEALSGLLTNSLEASINKRLTEISGIKQKLVSAGASAALMSGSGSAVFGLFLSESRARAAAGRLKRSGKKWQVFVASTV